MAHKKRGLVCAVLLFLAGGGYFAYHVNHDAVMDTARTVIAEKVADAVGIRVEMDTLDLVSPLTARADEVVLHTEDGQKLADVGSLTVHINPLAFLWNMDNPGAVVREIVLDKPSIYLSQKTDGGWNVDTLLKSESSDEMSLEAKIVVTEGQVHLSTGSDYWHIEDVEGTLELLADSVYSFDAHAKEGGATVHAKGKWGSGDGTAVIEGESIEIARYNQFLPSDWQALSVQGTIEDGSVVLRENAGELTASGDANLVGGGLVYDGITLSEASGHVTFTPEEVTLQMRGLAMGESVYASGSIYLDREETELDLAVAADAFDVAMIPNLDLPIDAVAKVDAKVSGAVSDLAVNATVWASGEAYGYRFDNLVAQVGYLRDMVAVRSAEFDAVGAHGVVQGVYNLDNSAYGFEVAIHGADTANFAEYVDGVEGRANLHLTIGGAGDEPSFKGRFTMAEGRYMEKDFSDLIIDFAKRGDMIQVAGASAKLEQGASLAMRGTIVGDAIDMRAFASQIPLAWLHNDKTCRGGIDIDATIGGTISSPTALMTLQANEGAILRQPFDRMEGSAEYRDGVLSIHDFVLRDYKLGMDSGHTVYGKIELTGEKNLDLYIDTQKIRAEALSGWIDMDTRLTGNLNNHLHVTGTMNQPLVDGTYELWSGSFGHLLIAESTGAYSWDEKGFHIADMQVALLNTRVELMGDVSPDRTIDFKIRAVDVEMERLHLNLPYPLEGKASFYGKLAGTLDDPTFKGAIRSDGLRLNGTLLETIKGNMTVENRILTVPEFSFTQGNGSYRFEGRFYFDETKRMTGKFNTTNGQLAPLLALFNMPNAGIDGELDGNITIGGTTDKPNVHVKGTMDKGMIKDKHPLTDVEIDARMVGSVITVDTFRAKQNDGMLAIQGSADLDGELAMEMAGNHIDAAILTDWFDMDVETHGDMDFAVQLTGTVSEPYANASVEIKNVGIAGTSFDKLVGLFVVDDRMLRINQLLLTKDEYRASAYGIVPFGAVIKREGIAVDASDEIDVTLELDNADLRVLALLTDEVTDGVGPMKGEVRISGTVDDPQFYGGVSIENGIVSLKQLKDPLENLDLSVIFDNKTITLRELSATMGGGMMSAHGEATLSGCEWDDYHFSMVLDKFCLNHLYYKGPLSGSLMFAKGEKRPMLSGNILIENATFDIPPIPEMGESEFDMAIDLTVEAGDKVRLYNSYLYDIWVFGKAHFGRTLKYPDTDGTFKVKRGTVSYLNTDFKVLEGQAKFDQVLSFIPSVHLRAETKIDRVKVLMSIDDPADQMQLKLTSTPAMNEQNIISLLTLRSRYFDKQDSNNNAFGRDELVGMLELGLQMSFVGAVENTVRDFFNIDEFKLVRDTISLEGFSTGRRSDREEVYNIQIGKYLTDRFMLRYTMGVGYDGYNFGLYYDVNPHIRTIATIDEDKDTFYGLETYFRF